MPTSTQKFVDRVSGLWIGKTLSNMERLCINSFIRNGHEFQLFTYGDVGGIPPGTTLRDAAEILPDGLWRPFAKSGGLALFADWFRWELLSREGGCYVDMDMVCLKPWRFAEEIVFGWQSIDLPCNAVIKFPKGHQTARHLASRCKSPNHIHAGDSLKRRVKKVARFLTGNDRTRIGWGEAGGPAAFQEAVQDYDLSRYGLPFSAFYPVHYLNWSTIFDDSFADTPDPFPASFGLHLWNENTRARPGWDKNAAFPEESFIERLKQKYGV